jgi:hypothetical protein
MDVRATPGFPLLSGYNTLSVCDVKQGIAWLWQNLVVVWYHKPGSDGLTSGEGVGEVIELGCYVSPLYDSTISNLDVAKDEET